MNMAPLPVNSSSLNVPRCDANRADEKILAAGSLVRSPRTPSTAEALEAKPKNRSQKVLKSPRLTSMSPLSNEKQTIESSSIKSPQTPGKKQSAPPPPPLSSSRSPTQKSSKSVSHNKSLSTRSPKTDLKHRQIASAAAEAASRRRHRKRRKKVQWNNSVRVKVVHNLGNYTPQEKLDSWYSADEYSMMEDECELTSIHMDEIELEQESLLQEEEKKNENYRRNMPAGFCERGLESWTMHGEELKEHRVQLVIDTVWQAQIDAWEFLGNHPSKANGTDNRSKKAIHDECWDFIRQKATEVSMPSVVRAQELAIKDEQEVDSYLNSVRSLEQSRRRISKMLGGKHSSTRSVSRSTRNLAKPNSSRTLATVSSTGSRSACGADNLKSILKSPKSKRYSDARLARKSPSQSPILSGRSRVSLSSYESRGGMSPHTSPRVSSKALRVRLPKYGNDGNSLRSKSMRSGSIRSGSIRSGSIRSGSIRSGSIRSGSIRSGSIRSGGSMRSGSIRSGNSVGSNSLSTTSLQQKKIRFKPKSKTKIPTSPVGSVCNSLLSSQNFSHSNGTMISDEDDLSNRMMRSHMSLSLQSDSSSRRRMLRAAPSKPPL